MTARRPEPRRTRRAVLAPLGLAAAGTAALTVLGLLAPPRLADGVGLAEVAFLAAAGAVAGGLWGPASLRQHHWAEPRRLARQLQLGDAVTRPALESREADEETASRAAAIAEGIGRWKERAERPDLRLAQIIAA